MTRTLAEMTTTPDPETPDDQIAEGETPQADILKKRRPDAESPDTPIPDTGTPATADGASGDDESGTPDTDAAPDGKEAGKADTPAADSRPSRLTGLRAPLTGARARRIGVIVLAVLAVAGIAGTAWFGSQWRSADNTDKAADAALVAARQFTTTLTSVSANSIDKDFAAVLAGSTGEFRQMYAKSSDQLRQLLVDNKAQAKGTVLASGVVSATTDKVVVLLFVDQTVQNVSNTQPRIDRSRIRITMTEHDGRWLAEKVELP